MELKRLETMAMLPGTYPLELSILSMDGESGPAPPTLNFSGMRRTGQVSVHAALTSSMVISKGIPFMAALALALIHVTLGGSSRRLIRWMSVLHREHLVSATGKSLRGFSWWQRLHSLVVCSEVSGLSSLSICSAVLFSLSRYAFWCFGE